MNVPKVVIVNYTIQDAFKIPASIDLADESVVKWGVTYNKLYIHFVDGTVKEIESVGWIDDFDYERPTGELEVDYAHNHGLEEEEEEEDEEEEEEEEDEEEEEEDNKPINSKVNLKMNQVSVGGRHIQYILENVLGQTILREDKGHPLKQDDKKEYKLSGGIISTNGSPYIEIRFYSTYTLTITDNLFTFPIVTLTGERHIMKVLTDQQQEAILIYCGFKEPANPTKDE